MQMLFLNKITFLPGFNNALYLHTFLYTAKNSHIHYHSGTSLKAGTWQQWVLMLTMRKQSLQGLTANLQCLNWNQNPSLRFPPTHHPALPAVGMDAPSLEVVASSRSIGGLRLQLLSTQCTRINPGTESYRAACLTDAEYGQKKQQSTWKAHIG